MNWTLEVVIVPVSDVDRSKAFYLEQLGFNVDHDTSVGDDVRIVQLTPSKFESAESCRNRQCPFVTSVEWQILPSEMICTRSSYQGS